MRLYNLPGRRKRDAGKRWRSVHQCRARERYFGRRGACAGRRVEGGRDRDARDVGGGRLQRGGYGTAVRARGGDVRGVACVTGGKLGEGGDQPRPGRDVCVLGAPESARWDGAAKKALGGAEGAASRRARPVAARVGVSVRSRWSPTRPSRAVRGPRDDASDAEARRRTSKRGSNGEPGVRNPIGDGCLPVGPGGRGRERRRAEGGDADRARGLRAGRDARQRRERPAKHVRARGSDPGACAAASDEAPVVNTR